MRKIEFKGLKINTKEWCFGSLLEKNDKYFIIEDVNFSKTIARISEIQKSTVSQNTGLFDKNGEQIFEGDILQYTKHQGYTMDSCLLQVRYDSINACFGYISSICMIDNYIFPFSQHDELQQDVLNHCKII